jgi:hypothetical protein
VVFVWILLALLAVFFGLTTSSRAFAVGGAGVVAGRRSLPVGWALVAVAALGGMFAVAFSEGRSWMLVLSWIVVGLLVVGTLLFRLMAPPIERIQPDALADRIEAYADGPGPHSMSFVVQGSLLATIQGDLQSGKLPRTKLSRHAMADGSCLYCVVEQCLEALFAAEDGRGDSMVREYRSLLRNGPNVEVHMRRPEASQPWHLEFAVPKQQPPWKSEFGRMACATHRPANLG